ncbi:MAG: hypothetical protein HQK54_14930, partial [Oligoflexales bacterium]|nr:hypothetical protein [Oligoflexales bacterium]
MNKKVKIAIVAVLALIAAIVWINCQSSDKNKDKTAEPAKQEVLQVSQPVAQEPAKPEFDIKSVIIHFDFDSYALSSET